MKLDRRIQKRQASDTPASHPVRTMDQVSVLTAITESTAAMSEKAAALPQGASDASFGVENQFFAKRRDLLSSHVRRAHTFKITVTKRFSR